MDFILIFVPIEDFFKVQNPKNHLCILLFIEIDEEIFCLFGDCPYDNRLCSQSARSR